MAPAKTRRTNPDAVDPAAAVGPAADAPATAAPSGDEPAATAGDRDGGATPPGTETAEAFRSGFVAVTGQANVGKSTLVNALVGEKVAIVSPRPQTTRRRILGIRTTDAAQAIFVDTPGIHDAAHELGRYMVKVAREAIPDADLVVWVVDVSRRPDALDERIAGWIRRADRPVVLALNKSDLLRPEDIRAHTDGYRALVDPVDWVLTIATEGHNIDPLWAMIAAHLPAGPAYYPDDQVTDQTDRMLVAELVREAALFHLQDEVPHGIEAFVEAWERRDDGFLRIGVKILVERESHKPIVIGRGGAMLKLIGTGARREIERLLDEHVFLELFVSVRPAWRRHAADVRRLGYT